MIIDLNVMSSWKVYVECKIRSIIGNGVIVKKVDFLSKIVGVIFFVDLDGGIVVYFFFEE